MDLSHGGSSSTNNNNNDFIDLIKNNREHHEEEEDEEDNDSLIHHKNGGGIKTDDIVPSYDFQPIRSLPDNSSSSFSRPWNSDSNSNSKNYGSLDSFEPAKVTVEKNQSAVDASILLEIDRTMKKHMDNLHHVLEGVSARLTQVETRTHHLESSMDDLKVSVGNNHGITDGKLRLLENILSEVQTGVHDIKDKQDIMQAQLQLAKLQVSKTTEQQSETQTRATSDAVQQTSSVSASAPLQTQHYLPSSYNLPQSIPVVSPPNAPPQQSLPPPAQLPNQYSQIPTPTPTVPQRDPYLPPPVQSQEIPNQQYQLPLTQQPHPQPGAPPHQQYQQTPHHQYSQPPPHLPPQQPPHSSGNPPQLQSSMGHHLEEPPYVPSQTYPPNLRQPPSQPPSGPPQPSQQFYGTPPQGYEPPSSRPGASYSSGYGTLSGPTEPYRYGGPPQYGSKQSQLPNASAASSGGNSYPQLPTARVLPQAIPTASAVSGGSGSPGAGNRVPVDDIVEKVATMGFPRDHVRATVRKLTENGQAVDLNTVLDKLMNEGGGGDMQQQRGWFGR